MTARGAVPVESLLAQRAWVRGLAGVLVAGEAQADDLAQQAWVEAIERPPAHDGALRAWFAKVLRRRARDTWRAGQRRRRRETAAVAHGTAPSAESIVAEAEAHRRVVEAVMGLAEPYRATVLLRFFEDLTPREIAARTDVPLDTVKTRLKRGVGRLRERLARDFGGDGRPWEAAILPLVGASKEPVAGASVGAATGGLVMSAAAKSAAAVAAVVLVVGFGAVLAVQETDPESDDTSAPVPRTSPADDEAGVPSAPDQMTVIVANPAAAPDPAAPAASAAAAEETPRVDAPEAEEAAVDVGALTEYTDARYRFTVKRPEGAGWRFEPRDEWCRIRLVYRDEQDVEWGRIDWSIHDTKRQTPGNIQGLADWYAEKGLRYEIREYAPNGRPRSSSEKIAGRDFLLVGAKGLGKGNREGWGSMERRVYMTKCDHMGAGHLILCANLVVRNGAEQAIKDAFYEAIEGMVLQVKAK